MGDSLTLLEKKVELVLNLVDQLRDENRTLTEENAILKSELTNIKRLSRNLKVSHSDQSEVLKTKLNSVLSRVEELEGLKL